MDAEREVRMLYQQLLNAWNDRDAAAFAAAFAEEGRAVGFDGTAHSGRPAIEADVGRIFRDHATPAYVALVRSVRFVAPSVALIDAVAGMVPDGHDDLDPALNAVQSLVAVRTSDGWRIALLQNTPAAYHGRPEVGDRLTEDLREVLHSAGGRWMTGPSRSPGK